MRNHLIIGASAIALAAVSFHVSAASHEEAAKAVAEETMETAKEAATEKAMDAAKEAASEATTETAAPSAAAPAQAPAAGQESQARPVEQFGDWTKECEMITDEKGKELEICQISQTLIDKESNQPMLKMAVGFVPDKDKPVAVITLPLGIFLPPGIELQVDGKGKVGRLPINTCLPSGCQAGVQLDDDFIGRMKKGNLMTITFGNPQGQGVAAPISLTGFTAGLQSVEGEK